MASVPIRTTPPLTDNSAALVSTAWVKAQTYLLPTGDGSQLSGITESQVINLIPHLALKAPLDSPALTGVPTAPTAPLATTTDQIATTAFVMQNVVPGPVGPQGPPGVANARYTNEWNWRNITTGGDPGLGRVAINTPGWAAATQIVISDKTAGGYDFPGHLIKVGDSIDIQEKANADNWAKYDVMNVTDLVTYMLYDVTFIDSGGFATPGNNVTVAVTALTQGVAASYWYNGTGPPPATTGRDGDMYLDNATDDVYAMSGGTWSIITNIKGSGSTIDETNLVHKTGDETISGNKTFTSPIIGTITGNITESQVTNLVSDLALKAPLNSPNLTGVPLAITAAPGTYTKQIATTEFVQSAIAGLVASGGGTTPGGVSGDIQFNNGASGFAGGGPTWNGSTLTATSFTGSGAGLTNIPESAVTNLTTDLGNKQPLSTTLTNLASTTYTAGTLLGGQGTGVPVAITIGAGLSLSSGILSSTAVATPPGGVTGDIQWNNSGVFAGSGPTWNGSILTAVSFAGNGAALTGVVHSTGNETISGNKTFSSPIIGTITGNITTAQVTGLDTALSGMQPVGSYITALTGDVTASGPGSAAATLATVNANVGSFTHASITVDGKGRITSAASGTAGTVSSVGLTLPVNVFSVSGSPVTTSGTLSATLLTQVPRTMFAGPTTGADAAPTFRVLAISDIPDLSTVYQVAGNYLTGNQTITLSGDVSGSGTTAITTTIGASKVTNAMLAGSIVFSKLVGTDIVITESQVTNLVSDLALKAPLANPALTGTPTAPTATAGTSTTQIANTAFVAAAISTLVAGGGGTTPGGVAGDLQFNNGASGFAGGGPSTDGTNLTVKGIVHVSTPGGTPTLRFNQDVNTGWRFSGTGSGQLYFQTTINNWVSASNIFFVDTTGNIQFSHDVNVSGNVNITSNLSFTGSISGNGAGLTGVVLTTGSYADPAWLTSLAGSKVSGNIPGNAASITGSITEGQVTNLTSDLATKATDTLVVHLAGTETITGVKTFTQTITGSVSGNAGTVTNGVYTTGSYADPAWITSLAGSKISGNIPGNAVSITGSITESQVTNLTTDLAAKQPLNATLTSLAGATYATGKLLGGQGTGVPAVVTVGSGLSLTAGTLTTTSTATSPGGATGDIQWNNAGAFAGAGPTWNTSTGFISPGNITTSATITGGYVASIGAGSGYGVYRRDTSVQGWTIYSAGGAFQIYNNAVNGDALVIDAGSNANFNANMVVAGLLAATELIARNGDPDGSSTKPQIAFGFNGTDQYTSWIATTHRGGQLAGNRIRFFTGDGTASAAFPANGVLGLSIEAGVSSAPKFTGIGTNQDYAFQAGPNGTMGMQCLAVNTCLIGDNLYNDGTNWKYKANGYGAMIYFSGGSAYFYTTGGNSNSTGGPAVAPLTQAMSIGATGNVGITGSLTVGGVTTFNSDVTTTHNIQAGFFMSVGAGSGYGVYRRDNINTQAWVIYSGSGAFQVFNVQLAQDALSIDAGSNANFAANMVVAGALNVNGAGINMAGYNWRISSGGDANWGMSVFNSGGSYHTRVNYSSGSGGDHRAGFYSSGPNQWVAYADDSRNFNVANQLNAGKFIGVGTNLDYAFQAGTMGMQAYATNNCWIADNLYFDGAWKYKANGYASSLYFLDGTVQFTIASSNSTGAGAAASPVTVFIVDASGNLNVTGNITTPGNVIAGRKVSVMASAGSSEFAANLDSTHGWRWIAVSGGLYLQYTTDGWGTATSPFIIDNSGNLSLTNNLAATNITAQQFFTTGASANYTCVRRDTQANAWQMTSQNGELNFWDYSNSTYGMYITAGSHEAHFQGKIVSDASGATDYNVQLGPNGTMGLQSIGANNCWLGDNLYNAGGAWKYKNNGYGVMLYFGGGSAYFYTTGTSSNSLGGPADAPLFQAMSIGATGDVGVTGNLTVSGTITGASTSLAIGSAISGSTVQAVLYTDSANKLAANSAFTYTPTGSKLAAPNFVATGGFSDASSAYAITNAGGVGLASGVFLTWCSGNAFSSADVQLSRPVAGVLAIKGPSGGGATTASPLVGVSLATNQNDWNPGTAMFIRLVLSNNINITGMKAGQPGQVCYIINGGGFTANFTFNDSASLAANRFIHYDSATVPLTGSRMIMCVYDDANPCWRIFLMG
jgi:hypothetical protein